MKRVAESLGVSRPHLHATKDKAPAVRETKPADIALLARIEPLVAQRPSYGYRRITALLNRDPTAARVNHKRVYRVMRQAGLLLPKYAAKPVRNHDGKVITLKSDLRWCSDAFQIRCWSGEVVHVAFSLDCCDREVIAWHASTAHINGADIRDLMARSIESRFGDTKTPRPLEWLTDNGPPYTACRTRAFAASVGLRPRNTPAYSPESNGMAESFVRTFKRDYVYLNDVWDAQTVLTQLDSWFQDYNDNHPHKGLKMLSPRQFRRLQTQ